MVHFDKPFLTIYWDNSIACVIMEWKKFVAGNDFRTGLDTGLQLIIDKRSTKWLADLRNLGVVAQEDQEWSNNNWFPRALIAGITHMAIVQPANIISKWSVDRILEKVANTNLTIHYFDDLDKARQWLNEQK